MPILFHTHIRRILALFNFPLFLIPILLFFFLQFPLHLSHVTRKLVINVIVLIFSLWLRSALLSHIYHIATVFILHIFHTFHYNYNIPFVLLYTLQRLRFLLYLSHFQFRLGWLFGRERWMLRGWMMLLLGSIGRIETVLKVLVKGGGVGGKWLIQGRFLHHYLVY